MKTNHVEQELIRLVKTKCEPRVVARFMTSMRRLEALERRLIGGKRQDNSSQQFGSADRERADHLITLCRNTLRKEDLPQILVAMGNLFHEHGDGQFAEETYTVALVCAEERQDTAMLAEGLMKRGDIYARQGKWKLANSDLNRSRQLFLTLHNQVARAQVENILGTICVEQGKLGLAQAHFGRALEALERNDQSLMTGSVLMNLGIVYNILSQPDRAIGHFKRAQAHFEEVGDVGRLSALHHNVGMSYLSKGITTDALREFGASQELSAAIGNINLGGLANLGKATAFFRMNDLATALKLVHQAMEAFTRTNDRLSIADAYKIKGMVYRELKQYAFSRSYLDTSLRINLELNNELNTGETYIEIGFLEKKRRNAAAAQEAFEQARVCLLRVGATSEADRAIEELKHFVVRKMKTTQGT
ncbi:MAG: tetratricopeptide repeat protein [Bacteroidota bacterium]